MDSVLKQLESRIEELIEAYGETKKRENDLAARVKELESQVASGTDLGEKVAGLEKQREELTTRLEKVLGLIDGTLAKVSDQ